MIDVHSIIAFFHKAKWLELAITHEMNRVLGGNTISYSAVGKDVRMFILSTKETNIAFVPESAGDFSLGDRMALVLAEKLFLSVRQIAEKMMISKSVAYRRLMQTIR
jgi:hypothetical protein